MFDALHFACRIIRVLLFCLQVDHGREGSGGRNGNLLQRWISVLKVSPKLRSGEYDKINFIALAHHRRNFSG